MNRIQKLLALLAFLTLALAPGFAELSHHDDDHDAMPHAESDCKCGCIHHVSINFLANVEVIDVPNSIGVFCLTFNYPRLESPINPLDRPPKLFS